MERDCNIHIPITESSAISLPITILHLLVVHSSFFVHVGSSRHLIVPGSSYASHHETVSAKIDCLEECNIVNLRQVGR